MTYTRVTEQYISTETVYYRDGVEVLRVENSDYSWYDTQSTEDMTEDEWEDEVGE